MPIITNNEWNQMNAERRKNNLPNADRDMVQFFINGKNSWQHWQSNNQHITAYDFRYLIFLHPLNFTGFIFNNLFNFNGATFTEKANFRGATFTKEAIFQKVTFTQSAVFAWTQFMKLVAFERASFTEDANFRNATFTQTADFSNATFTQSADFSLSNFLKPALFINTQFKGKQINFSKTIFEKNLILEQVKFTKTIPDFRHMAGKPDIRFHDVTILSPKDIPNKKQLKKLIKKKLKTPTLQGFIKIPLDVELRQMHKKLWQKDYEDQYRKLKEMAIDNHNHEYELRFFGYELTAKLHNYFLKKSSEKKSSEAAILMRDRLAIIPIRLYQWFSNFGQSLWRPATGLGFLALVYFLLLQFLPTAPPAPDAQNPNWVTNIFHAIRAITPIPPYRNYADIQALDFFIKIFALIFWFLFFLALRNRFKIK